MLRCVIRSLLPMTSRIHNLLSVSSVKCKVTLLQPSILQTIGLPKIQAMATAITKSMELEYPELQEGLNKKTIILIDVRRPDELREHGQIPGSINIPLNDLKLALNEFSDEEFQIRYGIPRPKVDDPVVFSCRSGNRSMQALQLALELGYVKAKHFIGGFNGWLKATSE